MKEFNEKINKLLKENQYQDIFPICEEMLNENISQNEKAQIYFIMASAYKELEKLNDAIICYSNCIKLDDNKEYAYVRKSELLLKLNRLEAAAFCCEQGLSKFKNNVILIEIKKQLSPCVAAAAEEEEEEVVTTTHKDNVQPVAIEKSYQQKDKETPVEKKSSKKKFIIIIVLIIVILAIAPLSFFAYNAYSSSDKEVDALLKQQVKNIKKKENKDEVQKALDKQNETEENIKSEKPIYIINGENPNDPFKGLIDGNSSYVFSESDRAKLSYSDVLNKTLDELFVARNEIFARHGYVFSENPKLDAYFRTKAWYVPKPSENVEPENEIELSNVDIIRQVEVSRIAHYNYGNKAIDGFVIKDSETRKITEEEVKKLKDWEIIIARNEIFARHNMKFGVPQIMDHFKKQSWYKSEEKFDESTITKLEYDNIEVLKKEENSRYSRMLKR